MNTNLLFLSPSYESSYIRIISQFDSSLSLARISRELSKLSKVKVSANSPSLYNAQITKKESGVYVIETPFFLYRDSRLFVISLIKWIERNGSTKNNHNLFVDLKVDNLFVDKIKFILYFDEPITYKRFPNNRSGLTSKSIRKFIPVQKFIPNTALHNPINYNIPDTSNSGINFENLEDGYIRLQYIGGLDYDKKIKEILSTITEFVDSFENSINNDEFNQEKLDLFKKLIKKTEKPRESYANYETWKSNYANVILTIDLINNTNLIKAYYPNLRDRLFDIFSNIEYKGNSLEINYDSSLSIFQIRDAKINSAKLNNIEFVDCEINNGQFLRCDFYECNINKSSLDQCNLYNDSKIEYSLLINSFANRTNELINTDVDGVNSVVNCKMTGGIFKIGKLGKFAELSKDTVVIRYGKLKTGFIVAGDKVIVPTKKYK